MIITSSQFRELSRPLIGLAVSEIWHRGGLKLFLELGDLMDWVEETEQGPKKRSNGQCSVMIRSDWRVEGPQSIYCGSWDYSLDTRHKVFRRIKQLKDKTILDISIEGRLPELVVTLSDGLWLHSFKESQGQSDWTIFLDSKLHTCLTVDRGRLIWERQ